MSATAPNTETPVTTSTVLGRLLAGAFLNDFKEGGKTAPQLIQQFTGKLKKWIGPEEIKMLFEGSEATSTASLFACLDYAMLDRLTPETEEILRKLEPSQKMTVELFYLTSTGRSLHKGNDRWAPPLWKLKNLVERYMELSPTQVTAEEILPVLKQIGWSFWQTMRDRVRKYV